MATGAFYNSYKQKLMQGTIDLENDTLKVALLDTTYTPDIDTHEFFDDVSDCELATGHGYTADGATVAGKSTTKNTTSDRSEFDCTDPTWTADETGFSCQYAILYKSTGDPSTSPLIAYWDFGGVQSPASITFNLIVNTAGLLHFT